MKPEDKQQYLDMIPRVFVRALRDPLGDNEFNLSEGEATDLLRRREAALPEEARNALRAAESWLERWADHVGRCRGGEQCTCGLTAVQYDIRAALKTQGEEA